MNISKAKVQLQLKTATQGALGQTVTWAPVASYWARIIPADVRTIATYQALDTVVTHKVIIQGTVDVALGLNRFVRGTTIYNPSATGQHLEGQTVVPVVEE